MRNTFGGYLGKYSRGIWGVHRGVHWGVHWGVHRGVHWGPSLSYHCRFVSSHFLTKLRKKSEERCERRRRLSGGGSGTDGPRATGCGGAGALCTSEGDFYTEWRQRLECWWLMTPHREALKGCASAFSLLLARRLEIAMGTLGRTATGGAHDAGAVEPGCEWLQESELKLPSFPQVTDEALKLEWEIPPIPRLLPLPQLLPRALLHSAAPASAGRAGVAGGAGGRSESDTMKTARNPRLVAVGAAFGAAAATAGLCLLRLAWHKRPHRYRSNQGGGGVRAPAPPPTLRLPADRCY